MPEFFNESYESAGYDEAGVTEVVGGSSTVDEDAALLFTRVGVGVKNLKLNVVAPDAGAYAFWSKSDQAVNYIGAIVYVDSLAFGEFKTTTLFGALTGGAQSVCSINLVELSASQAALYMMYNSDGATTVLSTIISINQNQPYYVEGYYNRTVGEWAFRIDGVEQDSGTLGTPTNTTSIFFSGLFADTTMTGTVYLDNLWWQDDGFRYTGFKKWLRNSNTVADGKMLKNTAGQATSTVLLDSNGVPVTAGTTTVYVTGDGGTQASGGTATHEGNGEWSFAPSQANTNYAQIGFTWVNAGAVTVHTPVFTELVQQTLDNAAGIAAIPTDLVDISALALEATVAALNNLSAAGVQAELVTYGANKVEPANADITAILADTNELQLNQGNWLTVTGYATAVAQVAMQANVTAVLLDTGTTLPATLVAMDTKLDAIAGYLDTEIAQILTDISNLNNISVAQLATEISDALNADTQAELVGVPAANASLSNKLTWVFMLARNKGTQTSTTKTLLADDGVTPVASSTVSDDGTTFIREEYS